MKKYSVVLMPVLVSLALFTLTACGGGGGGGDPALGTSSSSSASAGGASSSAGTDATAIVTGVDNGKSELQTGYFVDGKVSGLRFSTETTSGMTNAEGKYQFWPGETVQFSLYDTALSPTKAALVLTPADAGTVNVDYTINLLRFLQTVDLDADAANGIQLPTAKSGETWVFNFDQDIFVFEKDSKVLAFLAEYASGKSLVTIQAAVDHFNTTLAGFDASYTVDWRKTTAEFRAWDNTCSNVSAMKSLKLAALSFEDETYRVVGANGISMGSTPTALSSVTCSAANVIDTTYPYYRSAMNTFACGPVCTYTGMNRMGIQEVANVSSTLAGNKAVILIWHTPGTNKITNVRRYISFPSGVSYPLSTFTQEYTFTSKSASTSSATSSSLSSSEASTSSVSSSSASSTNSYVL